MLAEIKVKNHIAIISIHRDKVLNALNCDTIREIDALVENVRQDEQIRAVIFYSAKNFAAGADISEMVNCNGQDVRAFPYSPTYNKIESLPIPTISAIEGYALGGGLELALATDIRFADKRAKVGFPEVSLGVFPGAGGSVRLPKLVGEAKAKELIFSGMKIGAEEACRIGLINRVIEEGSVLDFAQDFAEKTAKNAPLALAAVKRVIEHGLKETDRHAAIDYEWQEWAKLFDTEDQKEGMQAFLEKRPACFRKK
ncbi:enoyl-CoA hydratase/isomerase family protein [Emergencia sp.]|uniref:enoyl-CoA hydratase/isomerase family protein n=1 Tax=Emergencia sp. TaxID=1926557 RepID=UPI003AF0298E